MDMDMDMSMNDVGETCDVTIPMFARHRSTTSSSSHVHVLKARFVVSMKEDVVARQQLLVLPATAALPCRYLRYMVAAVAIAVVICFNIRVQTC